MTHRLVAAAGLNEERRRAAASFAHAALTSYYDTLTTATAYAIIAEAFLDPHDEVGGALVELDPAGSPIGLVAGYPLAELAMRQRASLHRLLSALSRAEAGEFVGRARALAAQIPSIGSSGYYLARLGVDSVHHGSGSAARLLATIFADAGAVDTLLHVHRDNARAVAFYHRHGFVVTDDSLPYMVMRRMAIA